MSDPDPESFADDLLSFLNAGVTPFHAAARCAEILRGHGFSELAAGAPWRLEAGGKYYTTNNGSAVIAFAVDAGDPAGHGFRVVGAHTDSPSFKVKPGPCLVTPDGYVKINVETYGGAILSSWFDRPLSLAGRVALRDPGSPMPREALVDLAAPVAVIPNLCIHFNREVNEGYAYNRQLDTLPLLGLAGEGRNNRDRLLELVAAKLGVERGDILDHELFFHEFAPGVRTGVEGEFISAPRLDNLSMVYAGLRGLLASAPGSGVRLLAAFDHEEVGSSTAPGARSGFLLHVLRRVCACLGVDGDGFFRALANSVAVSADAAHAVHPNHPDKHDPANRPILGGGPAIKYSAGQKYSTNAVTAAMFMRVCEIAGVPRQQFVNRSDIAGGSTIGPAMSSITTIPTVDVGAPLLAMHSAREFGSLADAMYTARAFAAFFGGWGVADPNA